jgi:hypothetical protein
MQLANASVYLSRDPAAGSPIFRGSRVMAQSPHRAAIFGYLYYAASRPNRLRNGAVTALIERPMRITSSSFLATMP